MVSPFFPVFLMIISIFFKVVEQKSFETISVEHSKLHPYFSWWIKKKFFWPKVQSDQKGRCQKYLVISPKLFEPQKYIINSWVPKNWTFMLVCLSCIFLHIFVLFTPSPFFWIFYVLWKFSNVHKLLITFSVWYLQGISLGSIF